jgi:hypothetical protein
MAVPYSTRIAELNVGHPLNRLAAECIGSDGFDPSQQLAALALVEAWWVEGEFDRLIERRADWPKPAILMGALRRLQRAEPEAAMTFICAMDGSRLPPMDVLSSLEDDEIAQRILAAIANALNAGEALPAARDAAA